LSFAEYQATIWLFHTVPRRPPISEDIKEVIALITQGKLFELRNRLAEGQRMRCPELGIDAACCLFHACETGFHSLIEVLLTAEWDQADKDHALEKALQAKRLDIVELLLANGADPKAVDFADVCATVNVELMERFLQAGCDPEANNAFARGLDRTKARPLLRFLRSHISAIPNLRNQASLALACASEEKKTRWAAMLVWAGADPHMKVPDQLHSGWDFPEYGGRTAAEIACGSGDVELVKVLRLTPSAEEAQWLFSAAAIRSSPDLLGEILRTVPGNLINSGDPPSNDAVERFVRYEPYSPWGGTPDSERTDRSIRCLEMLLEAGARWAPKPDDVTRLRRDFLRVSPRYAVRVLRMLLYVPNAVDRNTVLDFCDHPRIRRLVDDGDSRLAREIQAMMEERRRGTSPNVDI